MEHDHTQDFEREWLTPSELSEWLGIGRTKVYSLLSSGAIASYRIGTLRRIRKSDIEKFLAQNKYT